MSLKRGIRYAKNRSKRVRAPKNAAPDVSRTQVKRRGESGGFRHECRRLRALLIGQCGARQPPQQGMTGPALLAPDRPDGLYGTRAVMSGPYRARNLTPTPTGGVVLTPGDPESSAASR